MELKDAIYTRRSIRSFKEDKLPKELILEVVKAGSYAPTGVNTQDIHFTVITNEDMLNELKTIGKEVIRENFFYNPPCLILVGYGLRSRTRESDCACAMQNMMLRAHDLGLGSVWINQFKGQENPLLLDFYKKLNIENQTIMFGLSLGYIKDGPRDLVRNINNYQIIE